MMKMVEREREMEGKAEERKGRRGEGRGGL